MCNLRIYNAVREVPEEAKKTISGGRLKGKTDINPLWRIKKLTDQFGPCGIGWRTENEAYQTHGNDATGEVAVVCTLNLRYIDPDTGNWSAPIFGVGGSMLIALENGYDGDGKKAKVLYLNDEAYKMAHTDALSVACKQLGMGASVYWEADRTKYSALQPDKPDEPEKASSRPAPAPVTVTRQTVYDPRPQIAEVKKKYHIDDQGFAAMRASLIAGGVLEDKPSKDMTEADWKALFDAIEANFGDAA